MKSDTKYEARKGYLLLHVFSTGVAEELGRSRGVGKAPYLRIHHARCADRVLPVVEEGLQAPAHHLLESDHQHAVGAAVGNGVPSHRQTRRARRAVVVDVYDGYLGHSELVEDSLPAG